MIGADCDGQSETKKKMMSNLIYVNKIKTSNTKMKLDKRNEVFQSKFSLSANK